MPPRLAPKPQKAHRTVAARSLTPQGIVSTPGRTRIPNLLIRSQLGLVLRSGVAWRLARWRWDLGVIASVEWVGVRLRCTPLRRNRVETPATRSSVWCDGPGSDCHRQFDKVGRIVQVVSDEPVAQPLRFTLVARPGR